MTTKSKKLAQELGHVTRTQVDSTGERVAMTLRVSRDSGRTWGLRTEVRIGTGPVVPVSLCAFPPCACPRCTGRERNSAEFVRTVS